MENLQNFQGMQGEQGLQGETIIADVCVVYTYKPYRHPLGHGHPLSPETCIECVNTYKEGYAKALPIRLSPNFAFVDNRDFGRPHITHSWEVL